MNLNKAEYNAVLTATTGNIDAYSFAAENQWHAQMQQTADAYQATLTIPNPTDLGLVAILGNYIEKHTIASDAGVGESRLGKYYEYQFKDPTSAMYQEHKKWH